MFLENCGKLFFLKMRPLFFFMLLIAPLSLALFILSQEARLIQGMQERFLAAKKKERLAMERKEEKKRFLERYSHADPYFLDQVIESFPLLAAEKKELEFIANHPAFPESIVIQERLAFLKENKLAFREEKIETSQEKKEVEEVQRYPVQMDENDLKAILSLLEDVPIDANVPKSHAPQILIKNFRLKKQETPLHTNVFEVEMTLIKREFTKS